MIKTKVAFIIFILTLFSCNKDFSFSSDENNIKNYSRINSTDFLKNPANFNNKKVEMKGVFYMDSESIYLIVENKKVYLDFNFYHELKDKNGNQLDGEKLLTFNGKQIIVKGRYVNGITGHLGCCEGKLIEITYFGNP
jgi:hypothetical protein